MNLTFLGMDDIPLPPQEIRFRSVRLEPYPDGRRVRLSVDVTPFQQRPTLDITLEDPQGQEAATASVIEPMMNRLELTLHLRGDMEVGHYTAYLVLGYPEREPADRAKATFELVGGT
jgi:hypothetical protein